MTLTVAMPFLDCALAFSDQRRSGVITGEFQGNFRKLEVFGARGLLMVGGLSDITAAVVRKLRERALADPDVLSLARLAQEIGAVEYSSMIARMIGPMKRAEFMLAGFDSHGRPIVVHVGLHDESFTVYTNEMALSGATDLIGPCRHVNEVLSRIGDVYVDQLAFEVIDRAAQNEPRAIGLPTDVALITRSGIRCKVVATRPAPDPDMRIRHVGNNFAFG